MGARNGGDSRWSAVLVVLVVPRSCSGGGGGIIVAEVRVRERGNRKSLLYLDFPLQIDFLLRDFIDPVSLLRICSETEDFSLDWRRVLERERRVRKIMLS